MPARTGTYPKHPISLLCLAAASLLWQGCSTKGTTAQAKKGDGGVPVAVTQVVEKDVPVDIQVVGNVEAYSTITVKAQVGGQLTKVSFNEGDYVKAGDLLFTIDPRPLEAQVSMSEANLAQNSAMLMQAQANLARDIAQEKYAQSNAERYARLWQQGIISKDQYEQVRTSADATSAVVAADKAAIESARAA
jgi:multidrug efflux system membrane fusion protein